jgi:hypothetical protein
MTATDNTEYRTLERESSNDLIRHDARRGDGKYAEAAWHALQAGHGRVRMGQIMSEAENAVEAAADWLSAAACFYLATDPTQMRAALDRAQQLQNEGRIPPERRDIHEALKERAEQLKSLEGKLVQFDQEYARAVQQMRAPAEVDGFLSGRLRELPGLPKLHVLLAVQARRLGQLTRAFEHLDWAEKFEPGNPRHGELRVRLLLAAGETTRAIPLGSELLEAHPDWVPLRLLLAQAVTSQPGAQRADWERSIALLRPLTEGNGTETEGRLLALALTTILRHGLGHEAEYRRSLSTFDREAQSLPSTHEQQVVSEMRRVLPHVFPQPGSPAALTPGRNEHQPPDELDSSTVRHFGTLVGLSAA